MKWAVFTSSLLLGTTLMGASTHENPKKQKWQPFLDVEGKLGSQRHLGEGDFFIPLVQDEDTLLYTDIRYRLDNKSSREGNFGLGLRHILPSEWIIGGYTYYDRRKTPYDNYFSQITAGLEALSVNWDFRANVYIPTGTKSHLEESYSSVAFTDAGIMYAQGEERSMKGYDAEIGYRLPIFDAHEEQQIRLYAGGFRFYEDDVQSIQGPRGRVDLTFDEVPFLWEGSRLTLGAEVQRDDVRGRQSFATLRIRIPLGTQNTNSPVQTLSAIEKRMTTPIIRDVDIVSQAGQFAKPEVVKTDGSGNSISLVNADTTSGADLKSIIENAEENSTIVLSGEFNGVNNITTLKEGQSIIGKGNVEITTPAGQKVSIPTPGASITGKGGYTTLTASNVFFRMSNNTSLIGITAHNTDTTGNGTAIVHMKDANNVTIKNNTLSVTSSQNAAYVITVDSSSNLYIGNNTLHMHNNGTFGSLIGFIQNGSPMTNITFENNIYNATGTANKSRVFYFFDVNISNLNGSNNSTDMAVGSMGTYMDSSTVTGNVSFTNGYTVQ